MDKRKILLITGVLLFVFLVIIFFIWKQKAAAPKPQTQTPLPTEQKKGASVPVFSQVEALAENVYFPQLSPDLNKIYYLKIDSNNKIFSFNSYDIINKTTVTDFDLSKKFIAPDNILNTTWSPSGKRVLLELNIKNALPVSGAYQSPFSDTPLGYTMYCLNLIDKTVELMPQGIDTASSGSSGLGKIWLDDDNLLYIFRSDQGGTEELDSRNMLKKTHAKIMDVVASEQKTFIAFNKIKRELFFGESHQVGDDTLYSISLDDQWLDRKEFGTYSGLFVSANEKYIVSSSQGQDSMSVNLIDTDSEAQNSVSIPNSTISLFVDNNGKIFINEGGASVKNMITVTDSDHEQNWNLPENNTIQWFSVINGGVYYVNSDNKLFKTL